MTEVETNFKQPKAPKPTPAQAKKIRTAVFERDQVCQLQGVDGAGECFGGLTPHHKRKAGQGGAYDPANLVALCCKHNDELESDADLAALARSMGLVVKTVDLAPARSFTVLVPGDPGSLNRDKKLHWSVVAEMVRQFRTDAYHLALMQRPIVTFTRPVLVTAATFKAKGVLPDPGNSYRAVKAIVDGLRDAGVLSNDTGAEITGVLLLAPQRGPDGLEVRLDEIAGNHEC